MRNEQPSVTTITPNSIAFLDFFDRRAGNWAGTFSDICQTVRAHFRLVGFLIRGRKGGREPPVSLFSFSFELSLCIFRRTCHPQNPKPEFYRGDSIIKWRVL